MGAPTAHARRADARGGASRGVPLGRVKGIPLRAHWTLLLALSLFAWVMATVYFRGVVGGDAAAWVWGAALAIALFVSVALHELAHSLVALRRGTQIREIILLPIGGASIMEHPTRDPRDELVIAAVGPLASLVIGVILSPSPGCSASRSSSRVSYPPHRRSC